MPTVYVALHGEGTEVWRPVPARHLQDSTYELLGIVPSQESWQFVPGQAVECDERGFGDGLTRLVACRIAKL
jgi:hypothetical protein